MYGEEELAIQLSWGVPQGSVLGPLLWNAMYDGLLRTTMPEGVALIVFADDVAWWADVTRPSTSKNQ